LVEKREGCINASLKVIGDKWTGLIVRDLATETQRFSHLQQSLRGISPRTLSERLDRLQACGVITKQVYAEVPPRTEYSLTPKGRDLLPILEAMADWGLKYL